MSDKHPNLDIKLLAVLGAASITIFLVVGVLGGGYILKETVRMLECENRSEKDPGCAPGPLWPLLEPLKNQILEEYGSSLFESPDE